MMNNYTIPVFILRNIEINYKKQLEFYKKKQRAKFIKKTALLTLSGFCIGTALADNNLSKNTFDFTKNSNQKILWSFSNSIILPIITLKGEKHIGIENTTYGIITCYFIIYMMKNKNV